MAFESQYKKPIYKGYIEQRYQIEDTSRDSIDYFRVTNFPTAVGGGKYVFSLQGNPNTLRVGSELDVEILDVNSNPIFSEVTNYKDRFNNYYVSFDIYDITTPGVATVTVVGLAAYNAAGVKLNTNLKDRFNVKWTGRFNVMPQERNEAPVIFDEPPQVGVAQVVIATRVPVSVTQSAYNFSVLTGSNWTYRGSPGIPEFKPKTLDPRLREIAINTQQGSATTNTVPPAVRNLLSGVKNGSVSSLGGSDGGGILIDESGSFTKELEGGIFSFFSSESLSSVVFRADTKYFDLKYTTQSFSNTNGFWGRVGVLNIAKGSDWTVVESSSFMTSFPYLRPEIRAQLPRNASFVNISYNNAGLPKQLIEYASTVVQVLNKNTLYLSEPVVLEYWNYTPYVKIGNERMRFDPGPFGQYDLPDDNESVRYRNSRQFRSVSSAGDITGPIPSYFSTIVDGKYKNAKATEIYSFTGSIVYLPPPVNYVTSSVVSQSFLQITFGDLNPISGQIYRIKTSAKLGSIVGDYKLINDQIIEPVEYLTDAAYPNQTTRGRRQSDYKLIGYFESQSLLDTYWTFFKEYPNLIGVVTGSMWSSGSYAQISAAYTQSGVFTTQFNQNYPVKKVFTLSFEALLDPDAELEIYMNSDPINLYAQVPQTYIRGFVKSGNTEKGRYGGGSNRFGKLIGKLTNETNGRKQFGKVSFDFETDGSGLGRPVFRTRIANNRQTSPSIALNSEVIPQTVYPVYYNTTGSAYITNVSIKPLVLNGFTPNLLQYAVPLPTEFVEASTLSQSIDFKIDYFDYTGKQSEFTTYLDDIILNYQSEIPSNTCQDQKLYFYATTGYNSSSINTPPSE